MTVQRCAASAMVLAGGAGLLGHLITDFLTKSAIVAGAVIVVLVGLILIWRKVGR